MWSTTIPRAAHRTTPRTGIIHVRKKISNNKRRPRAAAAAAPAPCQKMAGSKTPHAGGQRNKYGKVGMIRHRMIISLLLFPAKVVQRHIRANIRIRATCVIDVIVFSKRCHPARGYSTALRVSRVVVAAVAAGFVVQLLYHF